MRLIIRDIRKKYDNVNVIDDLSYTFESGNVYGITGGDGAGKTTLLKCISGEYSPDRGSVRMDNGVRSVRPTITDFAFLQKDGILPEYMTIGEYAGYGAELHNIDDPDRISGVISLMGIGDSRNKLIKDADDKEKFRIRLAVTLLTMPTVVMMDDVFDYDSEGCRKLMENAGDGHIIILTADKPEIIKSVCDETLTLYGGRLSGDGFSGGYNA